MQPYEDPLPYQLVFAVSLSVYSTSTVPTGAGRVVVVVKVVVVVEVLVVGEGLVVVVVGLVVVVGVGATGARGVVVVVDPFTAGAAVVVVVGPEVVVVVAATFDLGTVVAVVIAKVVLVVDASEAAWLAALDAASLALTGAAVTDVVALRPRCADLLVDGTPQAATARARRATNGFFMST